MVDEKNNEVVDMDEEVKQKLSEPEDGDTTKDEPSKEPESATENDKPVDERSE